MPAGLFHENYRTDERIFQTWFVRIWLIAFLLVWALFPLFASKYMISTMIEVGIAIIACQGLNLLTGFTGQISLGHAAFMGVGAYTSSILVSHGVPFSVSLACASSTAASLTVRSATVAADRATLNACASCVSAICSATRVRTVAMAYCVFALASSLARASLSASSAAARLSATSAIALFLRPLPYPRPRPLLAHAHR